MKTVTGVILLAGQSTRYNKGINKNLDSLDDKAVITHSIKKFLNNKYVNELILVVRTEDIDEVLKSIHSHAERTKPIKIVPGGSTRQESVYNALQIVNSDIVIIHDGARPLVRDKYIRNCIESMDDYYASTIAVKAKDTIKIGNDKNEVIETTDRANTWIVQTPQCFDAEILKFVHEKYQNINATDDCSLVEREGVIVKLIEGDYTNIKITTKEDMEIAKKLIKKQ